MEEILKCIAFKKTNCITVLRMILCWPEGGGGKKNTPCRTKTSIRAQIITTVISYHKKFQHTIFTLIFKYTKEIWTEHQTTLLSSTTSSPTILVIDENARSRVPNLSCTTNADRSTSRFTISSWSSCWLWLLWLRFVKKPQHRDMTTIPANVRYTTTHINTIVMIKNIVAVVVVAVVVGWWSVAMFVFVHGSAGSVVGREIKCSTDLTEKYRQVRSISDVLKTGRPDYDILPGNTSSLLRQLRWISSGINWRIDFWCSNEGWSIVRDHVTFLI